MKKVILRKAQAKDLDSMWNNIWQDKELAKYMQIIMITHQAIIASKSDRHIYVRKTQDATTNVDINVLEGDAKVKAIAELAGGEINDESLKFAQMLIK